MLRRFEIYSLDPAASAASVEAFTRAARDCARYIPEVLHSAIGHNRTAAPLHFVWEHAYASRESYVRYMEHPFHASRLDRFLMIDNPELITTGNDYGVGLAGYRCDGPVYFLPGGARRVVFLSLADGAEADFAAIARDQAGRQGMTLSTFHENTFGPRWMDGETWIGPQPRFSHIWEQGFASLDDALVHRADWQGAAAGMVTDSVDVVYAIEPGHGYADG